HIPPTQLQAAVRRTGQPVAKERRFFRVRRENEARLRRRLLRAMPACAEWKWERRLSFDAANSRHDPIPTPRPARVARLRSPGTAAAQGEGEVFLRARFRIGPTIPGSASSRS